MKKFFLITLLLGIALCLMGVSDSTSHDTLLRVTEVAIIDLNSSATITMLTQIPTAAGDEVEGEIDDSKKILYTSTTVSGEYRKVTVRIGSGSLPAGTELVIEATDIPTGCGTAAGAVTVTTSDQDLITDIGSCATGSIGASLQYSYNVTDTASLSVGNDLTITLVYTLTDAAIPE